MCDDKTSLGVMVFLFAVLQALTRKAKPSKVRKTETLVMFSILLASKKYKTSKLKHLPSKQDKVLIRKILIFLNFALHAETVRFTILGNYPNRKIT